MIYLWSELRLHRPNYIGNLIKFHMRKMTQSKGNSYSTLFVIIQIDFLFQHIQYICM